MLTAVASAETVAAPIDPLGPGHNGRYDDGVVAVSRRSEQGVLAHVLAERRPEVSANGFALHLLGRRTVLLHDLTPTAIDNDLAGQLAALLGPVGHGDSALFERLFTGIVRSVDADPVEAWTAFYRNTLARLTCPDPGSGSIGELAPVYRTGRSLVRGGSVLDVGSCFGFLPVLLARDGHRVIACDVSAGSMRLLSTVRAGIDARLATMSCLAQALPLSASTVDTVFVVHLLEHLDEAEGREVLAEAIRVARRRVVIAVPYEAEPTAAYGHVRTLDHHTLNELGVGTGLGFEVIDRNGGWLVVDLE